MRLLFSLLLAAVIGMPAFADDILRFQVDPAWPKPLPNDKVTLDADNAIELYDQGADHGAHEVATCGEHELVRPRS